MTNCKEPIVGDFVETIHNINGILTNIKDTPHGKIAFIATSDLRTFYCPLMDIKRKGDE